MLENITNVILVYLSVFPFICNHNVKVANGTSTWLFRC